MVISLPCAESPGDQTPGQVPPESDVLDDLAAQTELQA